VVLVSSVYNAGVKYLAILLAAASALAAADFRVGIIGTDTSHVTVFTGLLNGGNSGVRVVAAFKNGSPDIPESIGRVDQYANELQSKFGVEIVTSVAALLPKVDGVLLESNDGRVHLDQARQVIAAHKPLFIDKPLAATLEDAREIARIAKDARVPWFSSSSLRFGAIGTAKVAGITGVTTWGPGPLESHHYLELGWYAIHPVEILYTLMGPGCESVTRVYTPESDVIVGRWKDGRLGTVRAVRPYSDYGAIINVGRDTVVSHPKAGEATDYHPLIAEIIKFFQTGKPPVANEETLELIAFLDAAQKSKEQGGRPVTLR